MGNIIEWEGHQIEIIDRFLPSHLFISGETIIKVDGREIADYDDMTSATEEWNTIGSFEHSGKKVYVELESRSALLGIGYPDYVLKIDGVAIHSGKLKVENKAVGCLARLILFGGIGVLSFILMRALFSR